jgi:DivIVA domain-containing protein
MVDDESSRPHERETHSPAAPEPEHSFRELRHYVPQEILDVSFPATVRGYNRRAVDAYIKQVNRVIAELKVSASPPAAVRHALEQAEEKVQGLLHAAREAADELATSARREADASTARAQAEAAELVVNTSAEADRVKAEADELIANARRETDETVAKAKAGADEMVAEARAEAQNTLARAQAEADERLQRSREELAALRNEAETRMREIQADTAAVWKQRRELLDDIRGMASSLVDAANAAAGRFPRQQPTGPEEEMPRPEADAATEPAGIPTDQSTPARPAAGSNEGGNDESRDNVATPQA